MSRTFRRKVPHGKTDIKYELFDYVNWPCNWMHPTPIDPKSKEGKRRIARYRSDGGTVRFKEPGPSWYRHLTVERPQRLEARRQLRRFFRDKDYAVILNAKEPLDYWT